MKLGMVVTQTDPASVFNALGLAIYNLEQHDEVRIFLSGRGFDPRIHADDFRTFRSLDGAWGVYEQKGKKAKLTVLYGKLPLKTLDLAKFADAGKVKVKSTGKPQTVPVKDGRIQLPRRLSLAKGKSIEVTA